ncbi:MarR family transcriptional regulator [Bordetella petrii]|uniref:MarR family transcriptional regulator n=1 Tax=Bordetella petrii TaxID=94624 RepID=UPI001E48B186|nr:MarR family transcriptional regulator [Bordetella petrii]MCD0501485.1 MarR family transcriptional regulator [Bordetella petrii]
MNALTLPPAHARDTGPALQPADFALLADFRHELRRFSLFSEAQAHAQGLAPQQHQALLAIKASRAPLTVTDLARRLCVKSHSAAELVSRLAQMGMLAREPDPNDGRRVLLRLTPQAEGTLQALSTAHLEQLQGIRPLLAGLLEKFGG